MQITHQMENKNILITGGASGIGFATALEFGSQGANIILCGRNEEKGRDAVHKLKSQCGKSPLFIRCDVSSGSTVRSMFAKIENEIPSLDYAINGAAISKKGKLTVDFTEEEYDEIMDINVKGVFLCMKGELKIMLEQKHGVIINIASVLGIRANNSKNALYTVSKHAVIGLTKESSLEFADRGIRINAVLPGYTETEIIKDHLLDPERRKAIEQIHPMKRIMQPEEVAHAIYFLCSDEASGLTGVLLPVDGGCSAM